MTLAQQLGLRVHAPLVLRERALFIPRFDRVVQDGQVLRLAQESIATLTGMPGFESVPTHDQVCAALLRHCTNPQAEVLEYIKRDVANLALGNKDNHARNTAVQRDSLIFKTHAFLMGRLAAAHYGDKIQQEITGKDGAAFAPILNINVKK